jgi:hypothetical protein
MSEGQHVEVQHSAEVDQLKKDVESVYQDLYNVYTWAQRDDHESVLGATDLVALMDTLLDKMSDSCKPKDNYGPSSFDQQQIAEILNKARAVVKRLK